MKRCPKCGQTYEDKDLNFCFNDGELLSYLAPDAPASGHSERPLYANDPPPTEFLPASRVTNETRWTPPAAPPAVWQGNQAAPVNIPFSQYPTTFSPNQTLAIVSIGLGAASLTIGWCCYSGFLIGPAAIITGAIALVQIKSNPQLYSGRGLAIAGIASGAAFIVFFLLAIIFFGFVSAITN